VLGFSPVSASPVSAVPPFVPDVIAPPIVIGGGRRYRARPELIVGYGFGILPAIEGEAYAEVRPPSKGNPDQLDDLELLLLVALAA
jgi:hypothetical protein